MSIKIFEFKARVDNAAIYEQKLLLLNPTYIGIDEQIDTYFNVSHGRLKLREGAIENALIQYTRENISDLKESSVVLYKHKPDNALKEILKLQFGIKAIVNKKRSIYFINNIKFHFDIVEGLGHFIEVEAIDDNNMFMIDDLKSQCDYYYNYFKLDKSYLVDKSYSDLILPA